MVKLYLKDTYLSVPLFPPTQKGCGLLLGKAALEVHNLTIWADQRPLYTYQADKTNSGSFEEPGNLGHLVFGRHTDTVDHLERMRMQALQLGQDYEAQLQVNDHPISLPYHQYQGLDALESVLQLEQVWGLFSIDLFAS